MNIVLDNISKRYTTGWVLRNISHNISSGEHVAITGQNGSGKSTLVQIISGYLSTTQGSVEYTNEGQKIDRDDVYKQVAISAAYLELDEEFTVNELFEHYKIFKPVIVDSFSEFLEISDFKKEKDKQVRYFSSGMKQRLALSLAFNMDVSLLILDEPTSFLDEHRKSWYADMLENFSQDKTVLIASNDEFDIRSCTSRIAL